MKVVLDYFGIFGSPGLNFVTKLALLLLLLLSTVLFARHLIWECKGVSNLRLIIVDILNNVDHLSSDEIDDLLLRKEQFWIGALVTQHKWLNEIHDRRRSKPFQKEKWLNKWSFSTPVFSIFHGNQLTDLQYNSMHWFLYSRNTEIKRLN